MTEPRFRWTDAQELAIRTEGHDILVAAGAGAGKTTVLVERILRKLREGVIDDLDQVLVVTFTEKAARQMRTRLYEAMTGDGSLRRHLPQLARARISTIHAFCSRLLRENFLLAEVEPGFRVLDDHGRTEALAEALRQTFHHWYVRTDELGAEFGRLVEMAGFDEQGESLRLLVRRLHEFARTTIDPEAYLDRLADASAIDRTEEIPWLEELEEELAFRWERGRELYEEMVNRLEQAGLKTTVQREVLTQLRAYPRRPFRDPGAAAGFLDQVRAAGRLASGNVPSLDWGRLPNGSGKVPGVPQLHDTAKKKLIDPIVKLLGVSEEDLLAEERRRRKSLAVLVRLVREMDGIYDAYKRRGGWLDYSDLEVHAARILSGPVDLGVGFAEVLVDEYQDVNALQERILSAVAPPAGSFRVGDVKQSIYGFRLADPSIFLGVMDRSVALLSPESSVSEGRPVAIYMNENYRSRPAVLRFVNRIFSRVFDERTIGSDYGDQALVAGRAEEEAARPDPTSPGVMVSSSAAPAAPLVELHFIDIAASKSDPSLPSTKQLAISDAWIDPTELEARYVARRLRALADDPTLRHPTEGAPDWSRVAILLRSARRAPLYAAALLREGIPAELGGGGSLFEEPIVRDLRVVLRAIGNPRDDVAIAATLRCPSFAFGSADLLRIRMAFPSASSFLDAVVGVAYGEDATIPDALFPPGETARFGSPDESWTELVPASLRERCHRLLEQIVAWREMAAWNELAVLVAHVADALHLVPLGFAGGDGSRQRACLERFLGLARAYESERGPSLHGFLDRVALLDEADAVPTVSGTRGSGRGVRIHTVHKSKGLEFPVVVVPQLDWRVSTKDRLASRIRIDRDWVGLRWFDPETYTRRESVARQLLEWRQEATLREEEARILYVAMTRAEERLLLFGMHRGLPDPEPMPEAAWEVERRSASTMLSWIVGALPWGECEPVEPTLLRGLDLAPDPVPTFAEYHARLGGDTPGLAADEMSAAPPASGEYRLGDLRVCRVSKVVLAAALAGWCEEAEADPSRGSSATSEPGALGEALPVDGSDGELDRVLDRVRVRRPVPPVARLTQLRGKYWVTEFKSETDQERALSLREEATAFWFRQDDSPSKEPLPAPSDDIETPVLLEPSSPIVAPSDPTRRTEVGTRYHAWLARAPIDALTPERIRAAIDAEAERDPSWTENRDEAVETGLVRFFSSEWGRRLLAAGDRVEREVPFSLKWRVDELRRFVPALSDEIAALRDWSTEEWDAELARHWVLLQGRLDCVFPEAEGWVVVDWKTDRVPAHRVDERAERYRSQMALYREAVRELWGGPVRSVLVFAYSGEIRIEQG